MRATSNLTLPKQIEHTVLYAVTSCFLLLLLPTTALAASGAISQSYETDTTNIAQGTLLSLKTGGSNIAEPGNASNVSKLIGIAASKPLVELSNSNSDSVQVVVSGTAEAFVSDANGPVKVGDKITASPISGIGMKATTSTEIVGVAQANLDSVQTVAKSFKGTNGQNVSVKVGLLPIAVGVDYYTATSSQGAISSFIPPFLQSIANALTGKQVSPLRVLLGFVALLLGFTTAIAMLYIAIRSGVISIGRNPLAEAALRKGLADVIIAAIGVLVITIVLVYIVLFS